jgi:hypothetical protein
MLRPSSLLSVPTGNVEEDHRRIQPRQRAGGGQRQIVSHRAILGFAQAGGRNPQAEETGVVAGELRLQRRQITQIGHRKLAQFGVALRQRAPADAEHFADPRIAQAFSQRALAHHAAGAEDNHFHALSSRWSAAR